MLLVWREHCAKREPDLKNRFASVAPPIHPYGQEGQKTPFHNWSGKTLRQMAAEVDHVEAYDIFYADLSSFAHVDVHLADRFLQHKNNGLVWSQGADEFDVACVFRHAVRFLMCYMSLFAREFGQWSEAEVEECWQATARNGITEANRAPLALTAAKLQTQHQTPPVRTQPDHAQHRDLLHLPRQTNPQVEPIQIQARNVLPPQIPIPPRLECLRQSRHDPARGVLRQRRPRQQRSHRRTHLPCVHPRQVAHRQRILHRVAPTHIRGQNLARPRLLSVGSIQTVFVLPLRTSDTPAILICLAARGGQDGRNGRWLRAGRPSTRPTYPPRTGAIVRDRKRTIGNRDWRVGFCQSSMIQYLPSLTTFDGIVQ